MMPGGSRLGGNGGMSEGTPGNCARTTSVRAYCILAFDGRIALTDRIRCRCSE